MILNQNEGFEARRFKEDCYLNAFTNAGTSSGLYPGRNPSENLEPEERLEVVRYVVPSKQIQTKGEKTT